jgi:hypothetical protein
LWRSILRLRDRWTDTKRCGGGSETGKKRSTLIHAAHCSACRNHEGAKTHEARRFARPSVALTHLCGLGGLGG